ncbi:hypothetical protein P280DRAFT_471401 [Massarina eburnea CBS 473.64]|uniref:Uncharacterized protein n=1 Tax=Massarina eburnea CBS 473.64 TaxID=1395130 RepID=A0A6A6RWD2_9PLEO|nr:hypothetical protein P280DRAFT_471401 [Massarina eburnea CBS 473.64]
MFPVLELPKPWSARRFCFVILGIRIRDIASVTTLPYRANRHQTQAFGDCTLLGTQ